MQHNNTTQGHEPGQPACYQCPKCNASVISTHKAFQLIDLDHICKCNRCNNNVKAKDWMCNCQTRWHLCHIHQSCTSDILKQNDPINKPCRANKRPLGPFTHEQLVNIDTKRSRKEPPRILPPSPNILSVKLRDRFAHLFKWWVRVCCMPLHAVCCICTMSLWSHHPWLLHTVGKKK